MKRRIQQIAQKNKAALPACILTALLSLACFVSVSTARPESEMAGIQADNGGILETKTEKAKGLLAEDGAENDRRALPATPIFDLDEAIGHAILSGGEKEFWQEECMGEGHIKLGESQGKNGRTTVYALTMCGSYGFHDGYFVKNSGSDVIPAAMEFFYDDRQGYVLEAYQMPLDGAMYIPSIHELFPEDLWEKCLFIREETKASLKEQEQRYAKRYLQRIGRDAVIGDYAAAPHLLLTDVGVSVEVSNRLSRNEKNSLYPYWIGSLERVEDEVRYQYAMALDNEVQEIVYTKNEYETGKTVEVLRFDMNTGEETARKD